VKGTAENAEGAEGVSAKRSISTRGLAPRFTNKPTSSPVARKYEGQYENFYPRLSAFSAVVFNF